VLIKHFIFWYVIALVVKVACSRWHTSQVRCSSRYKLMCKSNGIGPQRSLYCNSVLWVKHVSFTRVHSIWSGNMVMA